MVRRKILIITNALFPVMILSSGSYKVGTGRSTIVTATALVITLLFVPLTVSTNNNILFESKLAFAQVQDGGLAGTTNTTVITNDTKPTLEPEAFLSYQNPTYGIAMLYPSDWIASASGLADYTDVIAFYSPLQNLSDLFPPRLTISVTIYSKNVSLPEYTDFVWKMVNQSQEVKVKSYSETTVDGYPGFRIVLAGTPSQNSTSIFYSMNTGIPVGDKVYTLTYTGDELRFNQYLSEVSQMLESLTIVQS